MDIIALLDKRGIKYEKTNNPYEIKISCTSGEHEDANPSMSYNLEKNVFNCWSCNFSGGSSKFLKSIGEAPDLNFASKQPYKISKVKEKLRQKLEIDEFKLPDDRRLFTEEFRGITGETYKKFGAFTSNDLKLQDYLCIPIYQHGKLKFIEGRLLKDLPNQPKYYRAPKHAKAGECLFPFDKLINTNYVILVEGLFDALNMWQNGYHNTLCTFGTNNFTTSNLKLLDNIGVTRVDIMMDSDKSGAKAAEKIAKMLDSRNIFARIIRLPAGVDPGELTQNKVKSLLA